MLLLSSATLQEKPEDVKELFMYVFNKQILSTYSTNEKTVLLNVDRLSFKTHTRARTHTRSSLYSKFKLPARIIQVLVSFTHSAFKAVSPVPSAL